jgi:hypothetical protein
VKSHFAVFFNHFFLAHKDQFAIGIFRHKKGAAFAAKRDDKPKGKKRENI